MQQSEFGKKIEYLRTRMSPVPKQTELAAAFGISQPTLSRYINGDTSPRTKDIPKIAGYFKLSAEQFNAFRVPNEDQESEENESALEESVLLNIKLTAEPGSLQRAIDKVRKMHMTYFGVQASTPVAA
jgi:transcriptional regulator with XRE-family HTH domain